MAEYGRNHYVPQWYQRRFFPAHLSEQKFHYLDLRPETVTRSKEITYTRKAVRRLGTASCFCQENLYTTKFGDWQSADIEKFFFGRIDNKASRAIDYFASFEHPSADGDAFNTLIECLSMQKLRTPKGLMQLGDILAIKDKNQMLLAMQQLKNIYCALWTECIWSIWDASASSIKFILSDHPVTVYNSKCFPGSEYCRDFRDPDIAFNGTHTLFPLDLNRLLVLTNLSWVRNPYQNPLSRRPNPNPFRSAMFNFTQIQINRNVVEDEVSTINYIFKTRAYRYVAAANPDWLFPEDSKKYLRWDDIGKSYFLMPDPRSVEFSSATYMGCDDGRVEAWDEYGRPPTSKDSEEQVFRNLEWRTFHAFQGEYARLFGPVRRGRTYISGRIEPAVDSDDFYKYHLSLESKFPKPILKQRKKKENYCETHG